MDKGRGSLRCTDEWYALFLILRPIIYLGRFVQQNSVWCTQWWRGLECLRSRIWRLQIFVWRICYTELGRIHRSELQNQHRDEVWMEGRYKRKYGRCFLYTNVFSGCPYLGHANRLFSRKLSLGNSFLWSTNSEFYRRRESRKCPRGINKLQLLCFRCNTEDGPLGSTECALDLVQLGFLWRLFRCREKNVI